MVEYRADLPRRPTRMLSLPLDERGFPVPWFVNWDDGKPDYRVIRPSGVAIAHNKRLCWLCGQPRGVYGAFVIGPMCGINRTTAEPPSHRECGEYAVRACPFMTRPLARRNERDLPDHVEPAGVMIKRNPGVTMLWVTKSYRPFRVDNGTLFRIGDPIAVEFYREGRRAERHEIDHSVATGIHLLEEPAHAQGTAAVAELNRLRTEFDAFVNQACAA